MDSQKTPSYSGQQVKPPVSNWQAKVLLAIPLGLFSVEADLPIVEAE